MLQREFNFFYAKLWLYLLFLSGVLRRRHRQLWKVILRQGYHYSIPRRHPLLAIRDPVTLDLVTLYFLYYM